MHTNTVETVVCRGAPEVPEPLTVVGGRYRTRYNTWKKFVRATRPALACVRPELNIRVIFSSKLAVPHLRNSTGQKPLAQNVQPLPWGDYGCCCLDRIIKRDL